MAARLKSSSSSISWRRRHEETRRGRAVFCYYNQQQWEHPEEMWAMTDAGNGDVLPRMKMRYSAAIDR